MMTPHSHTIESHGQAKGNTHIRDTQTYTSELVLPAADSSIETRVSNVTTSKFSKKNADCLMNSTEKSVQFSN